MQRKAIFDAVRRLLGRGFRQSEVAALDAAIDAALSPDPAQARSVSPRGIALIKQFEGCARVRRDGLVAAYPDPGTGGAPWTIVWTQARCDERLVRDIARHAADVAKAIGDAPTTQGQFDALVSFHYNTGAIARATLTARHKAGDYAGAGAEFARWNKAGGKVMRGLVRRRAAEAELYAQGSPR